LAIAQAAANSAATQALQDQLDRLQKIAEYRQDGLALAEATAKADSFVAARSLARELAASRQVEDPAGFVSSKDGFGRALADFEGFQQDEQDRLRDGFRYAFHDGVSAAIDGGVGGLMDSLGDRLRGRMLDGLADGIFEILSKSSGGTGALKGIGRLFGFADGGFVSGPGTGRSDSIPARLSNGEFVVNARATRQHRAMLEKINRGAPGLANGGIVGLASGRLPEMATRGPAVVHQHIQMDNRGAVIWEGEAAKLMAYADQAALRSGVVAAQVGSSMAKDGLRRSASRSLR
jgi:hypothetical protein